MKRIVHFTYAAIRRYGARRWTVQRGTIEINTNYVVSVSESEINGLYDNGRDFPYFVELSNGTKLLSIYVSLTPPTKSWAKLAKPLITGWPTTCTAAYRFTL